jgi:hypothetical protein
MPAVETVLGTVSERALRGSPGFAVDQGKPALSNRKTDKNPPISASLLCFVWN